MTEDKRVALGRAQLEKLNPDAFEKIREDLADIAPDFVEFIVAFGYGDIYNRPGLDPKSRQISTISALTALGNADPQLRFHMEAALNIGVTPEEIIETVYVVTLFAGFPAGLNSINAAREIFSKRRIYVGKSGSSNGDRRGRGLATMALTSRESGEDVLAGLKGIAPDMAGFLLEFAYGEVISRPCLSPEWKEIAMISAATARGTMTPQLRVHIQAALNLGMPKRIIVEIMYQLAVYAGFPAALNGIAAAREVFS